MLVLGNNNLCSPKGGLRALHRNAAHGGSVSACLNDGGQWRAGAARRRPLTTEAGPKSGGSPSDMHTGHLRLPDLGLRVLVQCLAASILAQAIASKQKYQGCLYNLQDRPPGRPPASSTARGNDRRPRIPPARDRRSPQPLSGPQGSGISRASATALEEVTRRLSQNARACDDEYNRIQIKAGANRSYDVAELDDHTVCSHFTL